MKQVSIIFFAMFLFAKINLGFSQSGEVEFLIDTSISIMKNNAVNEFLITIQYTIRLQ